jgi:hypothetical protein
MRVRVIEVIVAVTAVAVLITAMVPGAWRGAEEAPKVAVYLPPPRPPVQEIKAIYLTSWSAATPSRLNHAIQLVGKTELNAVVIDVKDFAGKVFFETSDPWIGEMKSVEPRLGDLKRLVDRLHENGIYVIVRIAVFQDQHLLKVRPDLAVRRASGEFWRDRMGLGWVDPASEEVWKYIVEIGREAARAGADELNFDYIRFPSDGDVEDIQYPIFDNRLRTRRQVIQTFFAYLTSQLRSTGAVLSADVFGLVTVRPDDMGIGQVLEDALMHFDVVSPMVYPSHYGAGFMQFRNPAAHPYEVVHYSLEKAAERRQRLFDALMAFTPPGTNAPAEMHVAAIRPWLQAFDLGAPYPPSAIRTQMKATTDAGFHSGWLLWSASNKYAGESFLREPQSGER